MLQWVQRGFKAKLRAQVSTEILVLFAFIIFLFIPALLFLSDKIHQKGERFSEKLGYTSAVLLAEYINAVGKAGEGSKLSAFLYFPPAVKQVNITRVSTGGVVRLVFKDGTTVLNPVRAKLDPSSLHVVFHGNERVICTFFHGHDGVVISCS